MIEPKLWQNYDTREYKQDQTMNLKLAIWLAASAVKQLVRSDRLRPDQYLLDLLTKQYLYAAAAGETWATMEWRGRKILKSPTDLWMYAELLQRVRPELVIETGTYEGGSALFMADLMNVFGISGKVVTIDIAPRKVPEHMRVTALAGSSLADNIVFHVTAMRDMTPKIVILDSDHSYKHVLAELRLYSCFLASGDYLIVEDTSTDMLDGGPRRAVREFLADNQEFQIDQNCERLGLTFNRGGYLTKL